MTCRRAPRHLAVFVTLGGLLLPACQSHGTHPSGSLPETPVPAVVHSRSAPAEPGVGAAPSAPAIRGDPGEPAGHPAPVPAFLDVEPAGRPSQAPSLDDLAMESSDPTAPLRAFSLIESYSPDSHVLRGDDSWYRNTLRAVLPFETGTLSHVLRLNQPLLHKAPEGMNEGANDLAVFDLITKTSPGFSYGIGADLSVPWGADGLSERKWSIGPAGAFKLARGRWLFAALLQNYFSVAGDGDAPDVARSIFQPLVVRDLGDGYTLGLAELNFTYDWRRERWIEVPLGLSVTKTTEIGCQAVKFTLTADYNFVSDLPAPDWTFRFAVTFLFP